MSRTSLRAVPAPTKPQTVPIADVTITWRQPDPSTPGAEWKQHTMTGAQLARVLTYIGIFCPASTEYFLAKDYDTPVFDMVELALHGGDELSAFETNAVRAAIAQIYARDHGELAEPSATVTISPKAGA